MKIYPDSLHPSRSELDLLDKGAVERFVMENRPESILHLAALTDVRRCERNHEEAWANNVNATENLVTACIRHIPDVRFTYMSTACVFSGERGNYSEDDLPYPDNFYSLTKLLGEFVARQLEKHLIVRANFVPREKWRYDRAFTDRYGTYLFADDLADAISRVAVTGLTGVVHIAGDRKISMFELAKITTPTVLPMTMADVDLPLPRDMSLTSLRLGLYKLRIQI